jgi:hypothetical protein
MKDFAEPIDSGDAEMRLLFVACMTVQAAAQTTPRGRDIQAPEWAWAAIEAAKAKFAGFDWQTIDCPEWQSQRRAAFAAQAEQKNQAAQSRADQIADAAKASDLQRLAQLGAKMLEVPEQYQRSMSALLWHKKYNPKGLYWTRTIGGVIQRR